MSRMSWPFAKHSPLPDVTKLNRLGGGSNGVVYDYKGGALKVMNEKSLIPEVNYARIAAEYDVGPKVLDQWNDDRQAYLTERFDCSLHDFLSHLDGERVHQEWKLQPIAVDELSSALQNLVERYTRARHKDFFHADGHAKNVLLNNVKREDKHAIFATLCDWSPRKKDKGEFPRGLVEDVRVKKMLSSFTNAIATL